MVPTETSALEASIKRLPGVLGCVVMANPDGTPAEIQAFTRAGADRDAIERAIRDESERRGLSERLGQIFVFELDAESHLGDRESLQRAAEMAEQEARAKGPLGVLHALGTLHSLAESAPEPQETIPRVPVRRVLLSSSSAEAEAEVVLGSESTDVTGSAAGQRSPHGARVVAEATLQAATRVVPGLQFSLVDVAVEDVLGREAVVVLVRGPDGRELLGSALVRDAPVSEAAVRATLDAINRRLSQAP